MENDNQILKGFNAGYIIQKYKPEMAEKMASELDGVDESYIKGFLAGAKEYQLEKELDKSKLFPGIDLGFDQNESGKDQDIDHNRKDKDMDMDI